MESTTEAHYFRTDHYVTHNRGKNPTNCQHFPEADFLFQQKSYPAETGWLFLFRHITERALQMRRSYWIDSGLALAGLR